MFRVNPLRCARGLSTSSNGTNFNSVALFNNDSTKILRVLDFLPTTVKIVSSSYTQTRLTNQNIGTISPVVTGEPTPPGQIDTGSLASLPAGDFNYAFGNVNLSLQPMWRGHVFPVAVIRPGWSFVLSDNTSADTLTCSFFWDWLWPDQLLNPHIGDPEIDY